MDIRTNNFLGFKILSFSRSVTQADLVVFFFCSYCSQLDSRHAPLWPANFLSVRKTRLLESLVVVKLLEKLSYTCASPSMRIHLPTEHAALPPSKQYAAST